MTDLVGCPGYWTDLATLAPIADRCWACDERRIADDSPAGLCGPCRERLRRVA